MSSNILFISRNDIIRRTPIGGNIDPEKLVPFIKTAQDKYIWIILGSAFYFYLQEQIAANFGSSLGKCFYINNEMIMKWA